MFSHDIVTVDIKRATLSFLKEPFHVTSYFVYEQGWRQSERGRKPSPISSGKFFKFRLESLMRCIPKGIQSPCRLLDFTIKENRFLNKTLNFSKFPPINTSNFQSFRQRIRYFSNIHKWKLQIFERYCAHKILVSPSFRQPVVDVRASGR